MLTKLCYKCKEEKEFELFNKDYLGKYGLSSKCKICANDSFYKYYNKNKEEINKRLSEYILCESCLEPYQRSNKTNHMKTKKHKEKAEEIENINLI